MFRPKLKELIPKKILSSKKDKEWEKEVFKQHSTHKGMRPLFAKLECLQILHRNFRASASIVAINKAEQSKVCSVINNTFVSHLCACRETKRNWQRRPRLLQPKQAPQLLPLPLLLLLLPVLLRVVLLPLPLLLLLLLPKLLSQKVCSQFCLAH